MLVFAGISLIGPWQVLPEGGPDRDAVSIGSGNRRMLPRGEKVGSFRGLWRGARATVGGSPDLRRWSRSRLDSPDARRPSSHGGLCNLLRHGPACPETPRLSLG